MVARVRIMDDFLADHALTAAWIFTALFFLWSCMNAFRFKNIRIRDWFITTLLKVRLYCPRCGTIRHKDCIAIAASFKWLYNVFERNMRKCAWITIAALFIHVYFFRHLYILKKAWVVTACDRAFKNLFLRKSIRAKDCIVHTPVKQWE